LASCNFNPIGVAYISSSKCSNNYPDLELILAATHPKNTLEDANYPKDLIKLLPILIRPKSFGYIKLASTNHEDEPKLDPKYFSSASDVNDIVEGK